MSNLKKQKHFNFFRDLIKNEIKTKKLVQISYKASDLFYELRSHYFYGNYSIGMAPLYTEDEKKIVLKYANEEILEKLRRLSDVVIVEMLKIFYNITLKLEDEINEILQNPKLDPFKQEKKILTLISKMDMIAEPLEKLPICYANI